MKTNEEMKLDEEKIYSAFRNKIKLHLSLQDRTWRNGIVKQVLATWFMFEDEKNGEEPIFFIELRKVEPFMEDREK